MCPEFVPKPHAVHVHSAGTGPIARLSTSNPNFQICIRLTGSLASSNMGWVGSAPTDPWSSEQRGSRVFNLGGVNRAPPNLGGGSGKGLH